MTGKNLVIMTRTSNIYFLNKAKEVSKKMGIQLTVIEPSEVDLPLEKFMEKYPGRLPDPKKTIFWNRVAGTSYNDYDQLVAKNWQILGAELLNSLNVHHHYRDKFHQYLHLKSLNLPLINTYYLPNMNLEMVNSNGPFVAKTLRGAKGKGVVKLEDKAALKDFLTLTSSMGDTRFIIQPFIEYQYEHRLLVLKGKVIGHFIKENSNEHWKHNLSNAQWKKAEKANERMLDIVEEINTLEQKFFYAIDFISKNDELTVLEVNMCPGIEGPDAILEHSILENVLSVI